MRGASSRAPFLGHALSIGPLVETCSSSVFVVLLTVPAVPLALRTRS